MAGFYISTDIISAMAVSCIILVFCNRPFIIILIRFPSPTCSAGQRQAIGRDRQADFLSFYSSP